MVASLGLPELGTAQPVLVRFIIKISPQTGIYPVPINTPVNVYPMPEAVLKL